MEAPATETHLKKQPFAYYVVLDFEATCDEDKQAWKGPPEIIEFPSVLICATTLKTVDEFHFYIKPEINPKLTLTGIQQSSIDAGIPLADALQRHKLWLQRKNLVKEDGTGAGCALVTCGDWDLDNMLPRQCSRLGIARSSYIKSFVNIKKVFQSFYKKENLLGMAGMLNVLGLALEGKHHSGIDDCRNLARILIHMVRAGAVMDFTTKEPAPVVAAPPPPPDNPALVAEAEKFARERTATKDDWNKYLASVVGAAEMDKKRLLGMYAANLWKAFSERHNVAQVSKNDKRSITSLFSDATVAISK